jgi:hypothetical protein
MGWSRGLVGCTQVQDCVCVCGAQAGAYRGCACWTSTQACLAAACTCKHALWQWSLQCPSIFRTQLHALLSSLAHVASSPWRGFMPAHLHAHHSHLHAPGTTRLQAPWAISLSMTPLTST